MVLVTCEEAKNGAASLTLPWAKYKLPDRQPASKTISWYGECQIIYVSIVTQLLCMKWTSIKPKEGPLEEYLPLPVQMAFHCLSCPLYIVLHRRNPSLPQNHLFQYSICHYHQIVLPLSFNCRNVCWINYSLVNKIKDELILGMDFLNCHSLATWLFFQCSTHLFTFNCRRGIAGWRSQRLTKRAILIVVAVLSKRVAALLFLFKCARRLYRWTPTTTKL